VITVEAPHEWLWTYVMLIVLNVLPLVVTSDARLSLSRRRW